MALIGNNRAVLSDPETGTEIVLNVTNSFEQSWDDNVSEHAIEDGSDIGDNVNLNPFSLNLSIILTDSKSGFEYINDRLSVKEKFDQVMEWRAGKTKLNFTYGKTIFSKLTKSDKIIKDLIIKSLSRKESKDLGNGIGLDMSLRELFTPSALEVVGVANVGKSGTKSDSLSDSQATALAG